MPEPTYIARIDTNPQKLVGEPYESRTEARAEARRLEAEEPGEYVAVALAVVEAATDLEPDAADREVSA